MPWAAVYFDDDLRAAANAAGRNYWHVYTREICQQLGLPFTELTRSGLRHGDLSDYRVLFLPDLEPKYLTPEEKQRLTAWVESGGLLIGFATGGLHELFGVIIEDTLAQPDDDFTPTAALRYVDGELARPLLPPGEEGTPLPVVAPVKLIGRSAGRELARLLSLQGRDWRRPAVTLHEVGQGQALYFCFNVAHSVWAMHHGRPVRDDYDGDGKLRIPDAMVLPPFPTSLPYADLLIFLLRNVIARRKVAFLDALPPLPGGEIPDALFHYGGDDEHLPGLQVRSSELMKGLGLPYHINLMPSSQGDFALSKAEFDLIRANGHEPSLHLNFIDGVTHPYAFTRREVQQQVDWYEAAFGEVPVCTVFHRTCWCGWTEPAEWLAGARVLADNSRLVTYCPPSNPLNCVGFGFGTALPYFHYRDFRKDNERLRFLALPIGGYEVGYQGDEVDLHTMRRAIDLARFWRLPLNLFYHPVYVATHPACLEGLRQGLAYMAQSGLRALHTAPDEMTRWWLARSETQLEQTAEGCDVECQWRDGCLVRLAVIDTVPTVSVDGVVCAPLRREEQGLQWLYVSVPAGRHEVRWANAGTDR